MAAPDNPPHSVRSSRPSPFFYTPPTAELDSLAILHLKRDSLLPVTLKATADDGYAEGAVTNTRFGSFPHSTLIGLEWGSQVRASKVDTGTRGRKGKKAKQEQATENGVLKGESHTKREGDQVDGDGQKGMDQAVERPRPESAAAATGPVDDTGASSKATKKRTSGDLEAVPSDPPAKRTKQSSTVAVEVARDAAQAPRAAIEAGSGFIHLLPPSPEAWTSSLDHRTQVVYTPDYSCILQRLRVRPGDHLIEAGAGSGSFTHAAARAVFSGGSAAKGLSETRDTGRGKVYSYEYHEPRVQTLRQELTAHGMDEIVHLTHRDVCNDGFALNPDTPQSPASPKANAIFLDLPAPWHALKHLTRSQPNSPLNPDTAVHLCTFSPCIEQVMATVSHLRKAGWTEIQMIEVQNKRIDVRREQIGLKNEGLRGVNASAATVEEAIGRLREVEGKLLDFHAAKSAGKDGADVAAGGGGRKVLSKQERLEKIKREAGERKLYKEGNLASRTEPEVKTHTSYLVFAVLPREWSEEDERRCGAEWPVDEVMKSAKADAKGEKGEGKAGT